jgi:hypothetical protein
MMTPRSQNPAPLHRKSFRESCFQTGRADLNSPKAGEYVACYRFLEFWVKSDLPEKPPIQSG